MAHQRGAINTSLKQKRRIPLLFPQGPPCRILAFPQISIPPNCVPSTFLTSLQTLSQQCPVCTQPATQGGLTPPPSFATHQAQDHVPGQDWQIDFTHMPPIKKYKHLLTVVNSFSGWVAACATTSEKAAEATRGPPRLHRPASVCHLLYIQMVALPLHLTSLRTQPER